MDPSSDKFAVADQSEDVKPRPRWFKQQAFDFFRYETDDDGIVQKVEDIPNPDELGRKRTSSPYPSAGILKQNHNERTDVSFASGVYATTSSNRGSTPVSFSIPAQGQKAPKYVHETRRRGTDHGPTALRSFPFHSHDSEGYCYWYSSQLDRDLDYPSAIATPQTLGTIYVHQNSIDGQYQLWMWMEKDGLTGWQPIDLSNEDVTHPRIPQRVLKLTRGEPRWILLSSLQTSRSRSRSGSKDRRNSKRAGSSISQAD
ncbi:hypothetical protein GYMLUDRAFT_245785 [Collybiopsis luxurians FD-317 M1]|uniref:Uncharacterized protein n=1 Tax=Collybiopsis luxurians FD-317 M1 TaxID=944289 RepID=A0A0D0B5P8_9AGAR|nr:hypothetical protein GYMLUDRAFT_245785 [Collybiopsis luxurians FD-317 M1]